MASPMSEVIMRGKKTLNVLNDCHSVKVVKGSSDASLYVNTAATFSVRS